MAFSTLDTAYAGLPYVDFGADQIKSDGLDYVFAGMPWYASENSLLSAGVTLLTFSTAEVQIHPVNRRYPSKRQEFVGETQTKHVEPMIGHQYAAYLP